MSIDLSSAGVTCSMPKEDTSGTMPTTGFTVVPGIKAIPDLNPEPSSLETTTLEAMEWKTYIPGLKGSGCLGIYRQQFRSVSDRLGFSCGGRGNGEGSRQIPFWFAIVIPGLTKAFLFYWKPLSSGLVRH